MFQARAVTDVSGGLGGCLPMFQARAVTDVSGGLGGCLPMFQEARAVAYRLMDTPRVS
jgi:hypothetical protein